ncbi:MAG: hypothetical protein NTV80_03355, partial [Verrucomicrobia bacterium]|nr:hypothetical protein [Verrucomicrobiota bacterium]
MEDLQPRSFQLATATTNASLKTASNPNVFYLNPGPWGKLRCSFIYIEAAKSLVEFFPLPSTQPRWAFAESQQDQ